MIIDLIAFADISKIERQIKVVFNFANFFMSKSVIIFLKNLSNL